MLDGLADRGTPGSRDRFPVEEIFSTCPSANMGADGLALEHARQADLI